MPALQVKEFPEDLYEELRECAAAEDRSISQQTLHILREYLNVYRKSGNDADCLVVTVSRADVAAVSSGTDTSEDLVAKRKKVLDDIDSMPKPKIPDDFPSSVEIIEEMREERMRSIVPELYENEDADGDAAPSAGSSLADESGDGE